METMSLPSWSSLAWRGFASILFGVLALVWPGVTLAVLTHMWGAYAFADGVLALVVAAQRGRVAHRWMLVLDGVLGIAAGLVTLFWPGITLLMLVLIIGVRSILMGALQIGAAFRLRKVVSAPVLYALGGLAGIALGALAFVMPRITALALASVLGIYALVFGIIEMVLAFRVRRVTHRAPVSAATA